MINKTLERKSFENYTKKKNKKLAVLLREIRLDNNLTLIDVAKLIGFTKWTIQKYESCVIPIPMGYVLFFFKKLDHSKKLIKFFDKL